MASSLLSVQDLTKTYPGFTLQQVSLELPGGCILGLIGPNGAGKTTLIRSILGLSKPDSGSVSLPDREEVGVVFDDCRFPEILTLKEVSRIHDGLYSSWDKAYFQQLCSRFALPEKKTIKSFSKGMKMKLSIAAALAHHPRLLLLDEPTSGLDPVVRDDILELFLEFIGDEEHSILFSSHITQDLEKVADYIAFLQNGSLKFCLPRDEAAQRFFLLKSGQELAGTIDRAYIAGQQKNAFSFLTLLFLPVPVTDGKAWAASHLPQGEYLIEPASLDDIMILSGKQLRV